MKGTAIDPKQTLPRWNLTRLNTDDLLIPPNPLLSRVKYHFVTDPATMKCWQLMMKLASQANVKMLRTRMNFIILVSSYFSSKFPSSDEPCEKVPEVSINKEVNKKAEIKIVRLKKV